MSNFGTKLDSLVSLEMAQGTRADPEKMSAMIEKLSSALAFTVAIAAEGDSRRISELLDGTSNYIYQTASERAPLAKMIAASTRRGV